MALLANYTNDGLMSGCSWISSASDGGLGHSEWI